MTGRGLALAAALAAAPASSLAAVYGLVIGIDAYTRIEPLRGAVNDARDIAAALEQIGAAEVRLLLDGAATRAAIMQAWRELAAKVGDGDVLVVSYAGHGGNEPDSPPFEEEDGLDENLLLAGFHPIGAPAGERIRDDEIAGLIAMTPQATVIMLADSCHSGTVTRSVATAMGYRFTSFGGIVDDPLPPPPADTPTESKAMETGVFFSAVPASEKAPELPIGGQIRGALSYAFADALRGAGDADRDGQLSKGEIEAHIRRFVRQATDGMQHPQVEPAGAEEQPLLPAAARAGKTPAPFAAAFDDLPKVALEIIGAPDPTTLRRVLGGAVEGGPASRERLVWDVAAGELRSGLGDVLIALPQGAPEKLLPQVQSVLDKMRAVHALQRAAGAEPMEVRFAEGDGLRLKGETVTLTVERRRHPHIAVADFAATGETQFVYPLAEYNDPVAVAPAGGFRLALEVRPPFGADHIVVIETADDLPAVRQALSRRNAQRDVRGLWNDLRAALQGRDHAVALFPFFTAEQ